MPLWINSNNFIPNDLFIEGQISKHMLLILAFGFLTNSKVTKLIKIEIDYLTRDPKRIILVIQWWMIKISSISAPKASVKWLNEPIELKECNSSILLDTYQYYEKNRINSITFRANGFYFIKQHDTF